VGLSDWVTAWLPAALPLGAGLPVLAAALYLVGAIAVRRGPDGWPAWRIVCWLVTCLLAAWTFAGAPEALRGGAPVWDGVILGSASAVLPLGIALGDPIRLIERRRGRSVRWLRGRLARLAMFPGFASLLSAVYLVLVVTARWYSPGRTGGVAWGLALAGALLVGVLVNVPLLSDDLLPAWATPPIRTLIAFLDGTLDAVPGIVMMLTVDLWAGGALLGVAEAIGVPMIAVTIAQWLRSDALETLRIDTELDAQERARAAREPTTDPDAPATTDNGLWWKSDPRFTDRF